MLLYSYFSGFVHVDNIESYLEKHGEFSKKCKKRGFQKAITECDQFIRDPKVSH